MKVGDQVMVQYGNKKEAGYMVRKSTILAMIEKDGAGVDRYLVKVAGVQLVGEATTPNPKYPADKDAELQCFCSRRFKKRFMLKDAAIALGFYEYAYQTWPEPEQIEEMAACVAQGF